ncbi:hypothetical protein BD410DRAFT_809143 [Rickenella mellea]|uniref:Uncharacterized protein n=1 Tax=Rickenella mellea TaxID=50990 RepID=A0A4Y7PIW4_9AGAM|nr:hypothetical protein BD410DRAFT_809143 [Rickenella mellea]
MPLWNEYSIFSPFPHYCTPQMGSAYGGVEPDSFEPMLRAGEQTYCAFEVSRFESVRDGGVKANLGVASASSSVSDHRESDGVSIKGGQAGADTVRPPAAASYQAQILVAVFLTVPTEAPAIFASKAASESWYFSWPTGIERSIVDAGMGADMEP